eukprot:12418376-Karenia_brevis.AAC.1
MFGGLVGLGLSGCVMPRLVRGVRAEGGLCRRAHHLGVSADKLGCLKQVGQQYRQDFDGRVYCKMAKILFFRG